MFCIFALSKNKVDVFPFTLEAMLEGFRELHTNKPEVRSVLALC